MSEAIVRELRAIARRLVAEGFDVSYYSDNRLVDGQSWIMIERNDNTGTVQYDRLNGYSVSFCIKPSRKYGSGLVVSVADSDDLSLDPRAARGERDPRTGSEVLECAYVATQPFYQNFAVPHPLPNAGAEHFAWTRGRRVRLTYDD